jgi:hypothetical protein
MKSMDVGVSAVSFSVHQSKDNMSIQASGKNSCLQKSASSVLAGSNAAGNINTANLAEEALMSETTS